MIKKQIKTAKTECDVVGDSTVKPDGTFVKGKKFIMDDKNWIVIETRHEDNTQMVRAVCQENGDEEWLMLTTLKKDVKDGKIRFVG